ncbi:MAG: 50S ribosomal protein L33 [candidate division WS6 bacterium GW2011_GWF2_39_15]|uniref:Large ribosomal subunit protein bL33 n=1 Tax=candidate division WS6 bacterium GW2011_GWF2_39_15 TaxID=1619100 RepID=A0A0G0MT80_9BACT|nr:MAG: 50S ribosomal protein L33 [candidate division WS6 bacterium GW2011_GWF2_39_15]
MAKVKRNIIALKCEVCAGKNYTMYKTKNVKEKIVKSKFCANCKKHTDHKETKAN